jgi:hypothetical protein
MAPHDDEARSEPRYELVLHGGCGYGLMAPVAVD